MDHMTYEERKDLYYRERWMDLNPMSLEEIKKIQYRKQRLEAKCWQLQQSVSGRGTSVLPLLRNHQEKYSGPGTQELAARLASFVPEELDGLPWVRREVFCDFAYCILRFVERSPGLYELQEPGYNYDFDSSKAAMAASEEDCKAGAGMAGWLTVPRLGGRWGFTGSFEDLVRAAKAACCFVYDTESACVRDEIARMTGMSPARISCTDNAFLRWQETFQNEVSVRGMEVVPGGRGPEAFLLMDEMYHRFCGHSIREDLARQLPELDSGAADKSRAAAAEQEDTLLAELEAFSDEYGELDKPDAGQEEEIRRFMGEGPCGRYGALRFSLAFFGSQRRTPPLHDPNLTEDFPHKEEFCERYLRLRRAYFDPKEDLTPQYLWHAMEMAVDTYLCRTRQSCCADDDDFFAAYGFLEQAVRQSRRVRQGGR